MRIKRFEEILEEHRLSITRFIELIRSKRGEH
jgi:hypothetical protein